MKNGEDQSTKIKALNAICASVLLCSLVYMLVAGVKMVALSAMVASLAGAATPVMMAGEGVFAILSGILEALFEGVMVIIEGIADFISGLFG
ncbi:MAG: hypothetical protein DWP95_13570 [Proteobacteria bacterium]|nr:MAG: hypothetical protein DWP95_13570 [Pseudomonadota bacterium]